MQKSGFLTSRLILLQVHNYLRSSNWDTRVAAAQAVQAIARNVPQWEPRGAAKQGKKFDVQD